MKQSQKVFRVSLFLCISSFLLVIFTGYSYWREKRHILTEAKNNAKQEAVKAATQIDAHLVTLKDSAKAIANDLRSGKLKKEQLLDRLRNTMEENPDFWQVGVAYVPYGYDPNIRLYAPSYKRKEGKIKLDQVEHSYDYTEPENDWYHRPLVEGETWVEPYFGKVAQSLLADFCTPFYQIEPTIKKQIPAGVVCANYSLDHLKEHMTSLELGKTGYGFIFSKQGILLCHPNSDFVKQQKTVFEIPRVQQSKHLQETLEKFIKQSQATVIDYNDQKFTGQKAWFFFEPIPSTDWSLGIVFIKDEILVNTPSQKDKLITIILGMISFCFFLSIILLKTYQGTVKSLWLLSFYSSIFLAMGIIAIWSMDITQNKISEIRSSNKRAIVFGKPGLRRFLNSQNQVTKNEKTSKRIPTGVFIQSLEFEDANDVFVTGYIWQKYKKGVHENIDKSFILPEAIDPKVKEIYREQQDNWEVIGWSFEAKLRQEFDYAKYPFDHKQVWLKLWHPHSYKNVILIPDFDSYDFINPIYKPGLEPDLFIAGWKIKGNFFEYHLNSYNTNFGINNYIGQKNSPELYFTIILQRDLINIFINNLMVPIVVALLLFLVHLLILNESDPLAIVSACSAFLFIVILDQINLRGKILAAGILYLEYFYFILYLLIIAVAINAILFSQRTNIRWLQYQENLILKLLYWPGILALLLMFTLFVF